MGISRGPEGFREVYGRIGTPSLRRQISDAWQFQVLCGPRLFLPLLTIWGAAAVLLSVLSLPPLAVMTWATWRHGAIPWIDPLSWPLSFQLALFLALVLLGMPAAFTLHLTHVAVQRLRRFGRYQWKSLRRDLELSMERTLSLSTIPFCFLVLLAVIVLLFAAYGFHLAVSPDLLPGEAILFAAASFLFFFWLLVFHPLLYVFPILVRRDCGWVHAWDSGLELMKLESREGLLKSAWCFLMIFTVVGVPGALALLLETVERNDLVLSAILGEKTRGEVEAALSEEEEWSDGALRPYHELLERGRYLDALNGFQHYLYRHPLDLDGWRGQSIAYLHMGHPKARESLERWASMDPESEEAAALLGELNSGRWSEGGDRLEDAQRRCTQILGKGI